MTKFVQDHWFKHFDAYLFIIQPKLQLELGPAVFFDVEFPKRTELSEDFEVSIKEFPEFTQYFSRQELEQKKKDEAAEAKARELNEILEAEMERLQTYLNKKLTLQEDKFIDKLSTTDAAK